MKCSRLSGFCPGMENFYIKGREANECGPGFQPVVLTNMMTQDNKLVGVSYKTAKKDKGILINFCPSCGAELGDLRQTWKEGGTP